MVGRTALVVPLVVGALGVPASAQEAPTIAPYQRPGLNQLVSLSSDGEQTEENSADAHTTADGRFVAFSSSATDLVPGDTNGQVDVFVRDTFAGTTRRVSVSSGGAEADGWSFQSNISADGRYVAFESYATNLTEEADPSNVDTAIFVHDLETGSTERITQAITGGPSLGNSKNPSLSGDGRYVSFFSSASDLVDGDTNGISDLFVYDRVAQETRRVMGAGGAEPDGASSFSQLSADGSVAAFRSAATNLVAGDENGEPDIFLYDLETGAVELISVATDGTQGNDDAFSVNISLSADGRFVAFQSSASNLVPNDTNGIPDPLWGSDVFVRDRESGTTERVSLTSAGEELPDAFSPSLSADGRYVAFHATRSDQDSTDWGAFADVFVHDRVTRSTERVSVTNRFADPVYGDSENATISGDGRFVYFQTSAPDFVPGDGNEYVDIVRRVRGPERGLLRGESKAMESDTMLSGTATFGGEVLVEAVDASEVASLPAGADITAASVTYRHEDGDLLFRLALDAIPGAEVVDPVVTGGSATIGATPFVYGFIFALDGQIFEIRASRASVTQGSVPSFARFVCGTTCVGTGVPLKGGFGTATDEIWISLPAPLMGLQPGEALESVAAYVGPGEVGTGVATAIDSLPVAAGIVVPEARVMLGRGAAAPDASGFEVGSYPFAGKFEELLGGGLVAGYKFWAKVCLDDRCGPAEPLGG